MFDFSQPGVNLWTVLISAAGAFAAFKHPDWAPWIVPLVGFFTHHSGKAEAKVGTSP